MKPLTDEQYNHALALVKGDPWHDPNCDCGLCGYCNGVSKNPDHLSNPYPFIKWMEKQMPDVWEAYIMWVFHTLNYDVEGNRTYTADINSILDLRNLVAYFVEHPEWAYTDCPNCEQGYAIRKVGHRMEGTTDRCQFCDGTGKVLSDWAREEEGK